MKATKRHILGDFSNRQLKVIELRAKGLSPAQIAEETGSTRQAVQSVIKWIYRRAGDAIPRQNGKRAENLAAWKRWAESLVLNEPLAPETPDIMPVREPKKFKGRIKLGRLRRAGLDRLGKNK